MKSLIILFGVFFLFFAGCAGDDDDDDVGWYPIPVDENDENALYFEMVKIPAGIFWMGCNDSVDADCQADESPGADVALDEYYIDKYEVSFTAYHLCVDEGVCRDVLNEADLANIPEGISGESPALLVTWDDAMNFCVWAEKTIPTEAQWEKAARGEDGLIYPWGNAWDELALNWFDQASSDDFLGGAVDGYSAMSPVTEFAEGQSPYGVFNMAGNVWEWTADWYDPNYYTDAPADNPTGPADGEFKTLRGGGWHLTYGNDPSPYRGSDRDDAYRPDQFHDVIGFRCVYNP